MGTFWGAPCGGIRLKGLLAFGVTALSLGYLAPTAGAAAGPGLVVPARIDAAPAAARSTAPAPDALRAGGFAGGGGDTLRLGPGGPTWQPLTPVLLNFRGTPMRAGLLADTVAQVLSDLGVAVGPGDRLLVDGAPAVLDQAISEGTRIDVVAVDRAIQLSTVRVGFLTRELADPALDVGLTRVGSAGVDGIQEVATEITTENGQVVAQREVSRHLTLAPQERVVFRGTRPPRLPADPGYGYTQALHSKNVTAYCLTGTTRTGTQAGPGSIAVDPSVIKLGSHLYVEGYGFGYAVDTGGGIHGDAVDLWMTCATAVQWGRRAVAVYVLDH